MNIDDFKTILEDIVHTTLYVSTDISKKQKDNLKKLKEYLHNSKNFIDDLRTLLQTRNSENYFAYDKYINCFLTDSNIEIRLDILNNQDKYEDIIRDNKLFLNIWDTLKTNEKVEYLEKKKKLTSIDLLLINNEISDTGNFKDNIILNETLNNEVIR